MAEPGVSENLKGDGPEGAQSLTPGDLAPTPEKRSFCRRFRKPINALTAMALIGGAWAGLSGKVGITAGGGVEFVNPFDGQKVTVGVTTGTRDRMEASGIPERVWEQILSDPSMEFFTVKIGSASFSGYVSKGEDKSHINIGLFTAGGIQR